MKKAYEKPRILETMPIERVLMGEIGEGIAPEWSNWSNTGAIPQAEGGALKGEEG